MGTLLLSLALDQLAARGCPLAIFGIDLSNAPSLACAKAMGAQRLGQSTERRNSNHVEPYVLFEVDLKR